MVEVPPTNAPDRDYYTPSIEYVSESCRAMIPKSSHSYRRREIVAPLDVTDILMRILSPTITNSSTQLGCLLNGRYVIMGKLNKRLGRRQSIVKISTSTFALD